MGPVRRRHLIRGLAIIVGLNMVVALVALYAHAGDASDRQARSRQAAGTSSSTSPGILAGGHFSKRRGTGTTATSGPSAPSGSNASGSNGSGSNGSGANGPGSTGPGSTGPGAPGTTGLTGPAGAAASGTATTTGPSGGGSAPAGATATTSGRPGSGGAAAGTTGTTTGSASGAAASGNGNHSGVVSDPTGDTFVDGGSAPIKEARADIVRAGAAYGPGGLTFTMQIAQPDDPLADKTWASDSTFAMWSVDTNADGKPDYEIDFTRDGAALSGVVARPGDSGATVCDASSATYGPDGYSVTVDPACLGNPAAVAFRATMYYDTNPKNDNADVASDVAPNGGMSFPVPRPS